MSRGRSLNLFPFHNLGLTLYTSSKRFWGFFDRGPVWNLRYPRPSLFGASTPRQRWLPHRYRPIHVTGFNDQVRKVGIHSHIGQIMADAPMVDRQRQFATAYGAINRYMESPLSRGGLIAGLPPDPALRKPDVEGVRLGVS